MERLLKTKAWVLIMIILLHLAFLFLMYCILSFLGFIKGVPTNQTLIRYDAVFYKSIVDSGYSYIPNTQCNIAFFPLFPIIWFISHGSAVVASLINLVMMLAGMVVIHKTYHLKAAEFLVLLSTPVLFFCYIPYSEAVFFLSSALALYGLEKNIKIALLGVFLACLSRSASTIFIPALLFTLFIVFKKEERKKHYCHYGLLVLSSLLSLVMAQVIQYIQTGHFFVFFEVQKQWSRVFKIPTLYLTTWDGVRLIWLDALAFFTGVLCGVICIGLSIRKLKNRHKSVSPSFVFSIAYLTMVTVIILFYSCVDTYLGGTSVYSLNRFVFSTPFFVVFLILSFRYFKLNCKNILVFVLSALAVGMLFNAHGYLPGLGIYDLPVFKTKLYFSIAFLYGGIYFLMLSLRVRQNLWSGLYVFNVILQLYLFNCFCNDRWVG